MQLAVAPHVADALARGAPVVALESTIIAHGLPYPANLEVAQALEDWPSAPAARPRPRSRWSTARSASACCPTTS
jgi:pseudouridine-5'-phosphate glycosidase